MNTKTKIKPRSNLQRAEIIPVLQIARLKLQRYFEKYLKFLWGISQFLIMYSTISCGTLVGEHFLSPGPGSQTMRSSEMPAIIYQPERRAKLPRT
jgi:hypothetical protein